MLRCIPTVSAASASSRSSRPNRTATEVTYRYGAKVVAVGAGDSLLFDATALHGVEAIQVQPVSYLSVVFTLRE